MASSSTQSSEGLGIYKVSELASFMFTLLVLHFKAFQYNVMSFSVTESSGDLLCNRGKQGKKSKDYMMLNKHKKPLDTNIPQENL